MVPTEYEMGEIGELFSKVSGIAVRWGLRMTPMDRAEFPTVFNSISELEKALMGASDALLTISTELGFTPSVPEKEVSLLPETYGDWSDLGVSIRERDPTIAVEVNNALTEIYQEVPASEEAKRWLMSKAKELNIPITWGLDCL